MNEQSPASGAPNGPQAPGTPPPGSADPGAGPNTRRPHPGADRFFDSVRRMGLARSGDRWVGGVASGIAERFGIDPLVVRAIFFVSFFIAGAGLVLYGLGWALLPERTDGRIHLQEAIRGNFDIALAGAIGVTILGLGRGNWAWSFWGLLDLGWLTGLFWLAAIVLVAIVGINLYHDQHKSDPQGIPTPPPPSTPSMQTPSMQTPSPTPPAHHRDNRVTEPPRPPKPPKPVKEHRGPGFLITGVIIGLSFIAGAILLFAARESGTDRISHLSLAAFGIFLVLAGLGIVIAGFRSRSSGVLGFLSIVTLVLALPMTAVFSTVDGFDARGETRVIADNEVRVITSAQIAEKGVTIGAGNETVDLSDLDLDGATGSDPVVVPISLGAGELTVTVPKDIPVQADVKMLGGQIRWDIDDPVSQEGALREGTFSSDEVKSGQAPVLVLDVNVGAGQANIREDS